jgi:hypothetical protein
MKEIVVHRFDSLYSIMKKLNIVNNYSEYYSLINSSTPIFIDNERIYNESYEVDFIIEHKNNYSLKVYSILRIGGSYNPNNESNGEKYLLIRSDSKTKDF